MQVPLLVAHDLFLRQPCHPGELVVDDGNAASLVGYENTVTIVFEKIAGNRQRFFGCLVRRDIQRDAFEQD